MQFNAKPLFLFENVFSKGTLTATDTDSDATFDVENIINQVVYQLWKAASSGTKHITVDLNKTVNGGAEDGVGGNWTLNDATVENTNPNSGTYSFELVATGSGVDGAENNKMAVDPTKTWRLKSQHDVDAYTEGSYRVKLHFYDSEDNLISTTTLVTHTAATVGYVEETNAIGPTGADVVFPAGTASISVQDAWDATASAWDLGTGEYDNVFGFVGAEDTVPDGVFFKPDGLKMYMVGHTNDKVHQYTLATAWDPSSLIDDGVPVDVSGQELVPNAIFFKPDGLKMYVMGANRKIHQYTLATAWDFSDTVTYDNEFVALAEDTSPVGIFFKPDGLRMYMLGTTNDKVYQYTLNTAWDFSDTVTYDTVFLDIGTEDIAPFDIFFKPDGLRMYMLGQTGQKVYQYSIGEVTGTAYMDDVIMYEEFDPDTLGIANHNLWAANASVSIESTEDDTEVISSWTERLAAFTPAQTDKDIILKQFTAVGTPQRAWRVKIVTANLPAYMGDMKLGSALTFPRWVQGPFGPKPRKVEGKVADNQFGQFIQRVVIRREAEISMTFRRLTTSFIEDTLRPAFEDFLISGMFYVSWDIDQHETHKLIGFMPDGAELNPVYSGALLSVTLRVMPMPVA